MIKEGGLSFETQLKIELLPTNNGSKKCLEKSLPMCYQYRLNDWKQIDEKQTLTVRLT